MRLEARCDRLMINSQPAVELMIRPGPAGVERLSCPSLSTSDRDREDFVIDAARARPAVREQQRIGIRSRSEEMKCQMLMSVL